MPKPQRMEDNHPWFVGCVLTTTNCFPNLKAVTESERDSDSLGERGLSANGHLVLASEQLAASLIVKSGQPHHSQPPPPSSISQTLSRSIKRPRRRRRPHRRPRPQPNNPGPDMASRNPNGAQPCGLEAIPRGGENSNPLTPSTLRGLFPRLKGDSVEDMATRIRHLEEVKDRSYGISNGNSVQNKQAPRCG